MAVYMQPEQENQEKDEWLTTEQAMTYAGWTYFQLNRKTRNGQLVSRRYELDRRIRLISKRSLDHLLSFRRDDI